MRGAGAFPGALAGATLGLFGGFWLGIVALSPLFCLAWPAFRECPASSSWYGVEWVSNLGAHAGAAVGAALAARLPGGRFLRPFLAAAALSALGAAAMYALQALDLTRYLILQGPLAVLLAALGSQLARRRG